MELEFSVYGLCKLHVSTLLIISSRVKRRGSTCTACWIQVQNYIHPENSTEVKLSFAAMNLNTY